MRKLVVGLVLIILLNGCDVYQPIGSLGYFFDKNDTIGGVIVGYKRPYYHFKTWKHSDAYVRKDSIIWETLDYNSN